MSGPQTLNMGLVVGRSRGSARGARLWCYHSIP